MKLIKKAYLLAIVAVIMGSSGPSVFLSALQNMDREAGVTIFLFIGSITMMIIAYIESLIKKFEFISTTRKAITEIPFWQWLVSGISASVVYVFFACSMQCKSVTETTLAYRVAPILCIVLAAIILGEKIRRWWQLSLAMAICLLGVMITLNVQKPSAHALQDPFLLFTFIAALAYAVRMNMERLIQKNSNLSKNVIACFIMFVGFLSMFAYLIVMNKPIAIYDTKNYLLLAYVGIFTIGFPIVLNLWAYDLTQNFSRLAPFQFLLPIFGVIYAHLINGERGFKYWNLAIGFLVISLGIWLANKSVKN